MKSHTEDGVLVLADISGFTEFVTATELEHGPPIIAELLGEVMRQISPPLEIQEVEGDAVFALGADRARARRPACSRCWKTRSSRSEIGSTSSWRTRAAAATRAGASGASISRSSPITGGSCFRRR